MHFLKFEVDEIDRCLGFIQQLKADQKSLNGPGSEELCVTATGGGAYKYYDTMKEVLGLEILREDEMECLILGMWKRRVVILMYVKVDARTGHRT